jgi:methylated-DNA-[protein]-cysteine S-methyltransferase
MPKNPFGFSIDPQAAQDAHKRGLPKKVCFVSTPFGTMTLVQRGDALSELRLEGGVLDNETVTDTPLLQEAATQLRAYFAGERMAFELPLAPLGTPFMVKVWETLAQTVPYGCTLSYGELAKRIGHARASRAVGMANHRNPLPIFIPCHRVIGSNGKLVGYGGGLELKQALLTLENAKITTR